MLAFNCSCGKVFGMPRLPGRTARAHLGPTVVLHTRVRAETHAKAHAAARALGISVAEYLATLVERDELDAFGRPCWAEEAMRARALPGLDKPGVVA